MKIYHVKHDKLSFVECLKCDHFLGGSLGIGRSTMVALVNDTLRNSQLPRRRARRAALWELGTTLALWAQRRRETHELAKLHARELHDIGLTPADVQMALDKPFWRA